MAVSHLQIHPQCRRVARRSTSGCVPSSCPVQKWENGKTPPRAVSPSLISVLEAKGEDVFWHERSSVHLTRTVLGITTASTRRAQLRSFLSTWERTLLPVPPAAGKARAEPTQPAFRSLSRSPGTPLAAGAARGTHPARSRGSGAAAGPWPAARGPAAASPGAAARSYPSFVCLFRVSRNQASSHSSTCSPAAAPRESLCYRHPSSSSQQHTALWKASRPSNCTTRERRRQRVPLAVR